MKKYIVKGTDLPSLLSKVAKHFNVDINKIKYEIREYKIMLAQ